MNIDTVACYLIMTNHVSTLKLIMFSNNLTDILTF